MNRSNANIDPHDQAQIDISASTWEWEGGALYRPRSDDGDADDELPGTDSNASIGPTQ
jgi:hypothetical protein